MSYDSEKFKNEIFSLELKYIRQNYLAGAKTLAYTLVEYSGLLSVIYDVSRGEITPRILIAGATLYIGGRILNKIVNHRIKDLERRILDGKIQIAQDETQEVRKELWKLQDRLREIENARTRDIPFIYRS